MFDCEAIAFHEDFSLRRDPLAGRFADVWPQVGDIATVIKMQFPGPAVVVQAVGDIGVLLNLADGQPSTDRMHGARRHINEVTGRHSAPISVMLDVTALEGRAKAFGSQLLF